MRITLIDDSIPFDGATPKIKPLGGAEKAFVYLSETLAARGHDVTAVNQCDAYSELNGVTWLPFDAPRPLESEVLIAFRKPSLLEEVDSVDLRILWLWGPASLPDQAANQVLLERYMPTLVFLGETHRQSWKSQRNFKEAIIVPGVTDAYLEFEDDKSEPEPIAIITTHPLHGLQELLQLWLDGIRPRNDRAQLHIYSASLSRGIETGEVANRMKDLLSIAGKAQNRGIFIKLPMPDVDMAKNYRYAKLHFYPMIKTEMYGSTLAESQAAGLPALVLAATGDVGAVAERVCNGQSGYIAPDNAAFINLAAEILAENSELYWSLHREALTLQKYRTWHIAAIEFEALWS